MTGDGRTRTEGETEDGPRAPSVSATSPYPMSRLAPAFDLVNVAREIQDADALLGAVVSDKLEMLAAQIRGLQEQAKKVLDDAQRDAVLHRATCHFKKRPGAIYHLYERENGTLYFSMLSPDDWAGAPPHPFRGSYRLEVDLSFTPAEDLARKADSAELVKRLLSAG